MKTSELTGELLNYWTAKAVGFSIEPYLDGRRLRDSKGCACAHIGITSHAFLPRYSPSTDWSQGGPLLEMDRIEVSDGGPFWSASMTPGNGVEFHQLGDTYLQAAMRCLVASKYGDEVPDGEETKA